MHCRPIETTMHVTDDVRHTCDSQPILWAPAVQIMRFDLQQVWRATWQRWAAAYAARQRLYAARDELLRGMLRRVVRHWKAWVDKKADWRAFSEDVMTKIILRRWALHT